MTEFEAMVPTPDGDMDCFIAHPDGDGPYAAVILYMDVPGIREELRNFARRIAGEGYLCVLPNLYYRHGKISFDLTKGEEEFKRMFAMGSGLSNAMINSDTGGMLEWLDASPLVSGKTGSIGYCMSGQFVISTAGTYPDHFGAVASLYGTQMVTDAEDSPHLLADKIKAEIYLGYAAHDPYVPEEVIPTLDAALDENGVAHTTEIHPGTEHGFCFPERPGYVEDAAEKVWTTVFDLYERTLKSTV